MNKRKRRNFTLIELMVVMLLMGLIMTLMLPSFNRMIRGNKVDQLASGLKLGMEQAQSHAATSRKYVAMVLPNKMSEWSASDTGENAVRPFCFGGYRLAYVEREGAKGSNLWKFVRWVPNQDWKNMPDGSLLVGVYAKDKDSNYNSAFKTGKGIKAQITNPKTDDFGDRLSELKDCKADKDSTADNKGNCLIVFSPYGGVESTRDLRFVIAEAIPLSETELAFPGRGADGPVNCLVLELNKFTGRVEYYPYPD